VTRTWTAGDTVRFSGHATDAEDGTLPTSALSWTLIIHHCFTPNDCHTHMIANFTGVARKNMDARWA